jgi:dolichyl-phosphate beta-glucosyltransferase
VSGDPTVSVVIPCYNEEGNLRQGVLNRVSSFVERAPYCCEVLVVDDGSRDASADLIGAFADEHSGFRLLREPHRGKAGAIVAGVSAAGGDWILFCDMDQATPIDELARLRPHMLDGCDVVVGSRAGRREGAPIVRRLMARGFILV